MIANEDRLSRFYAHGYATARDQLVDERNPAVIRELARRVDDEQRRTVVGSDRWAFWLGVATGIGVRR